MLNHHAWEIGKSSKFIVKSFKWAFTTQWERGAAGSQVLSLLPPEGSKKQISYLHHPTRLLPPTFGFDTRKCWVQNWFPQALCQTTGFAWCKSEDRGAPISWQRGGDKSWAAEWQDLKRCMALAEQHENNRSPKPIFGDLFYHRFTWPNHWCLLHVLWIHMAQPPKDRTITGKASVPKQNYQIALAWIGLVALCSWEILIQKRTSCHVGFGKS